jgi:hypothetical protein
VASNLRRSKRTVGKKINDIDRRVTRMQRTPPARRIGRGVIAASNIAQNAVSYPQLAAPISSDISGAQATADGKNTIFYSAAVPVANKAGDIWFDTDDSYKLYRALSDGANAIGVGKWEQAVVNASNLTVGTLDASQVTVSNLDAGRITVGTLSGRRVVCQETTDAGFISIRTTAEILSTGSISSNYEYFGLGSSYFSKITLNSKEEFEGEGIKVTGNAESGNFNTSRMTQTLVSTTGNMFATSFNPTSDIRLKENVKDIPLSTAIDIVKQLRPVTFDFTRTGKSSHGFIAQEVYDVCEDFVVVGGEDVSVAPWAVNYMSIIPALTSALQSCLTKIDDLETRLAALEN